MTLAEVAPMPNARNAEETLQRVLDEHKGNLDYVVVIVMHKDRTRSIMTSMASQEEKALLKCFWDSWVLDWFRD